MPLNISNMSLLEKCAEAIVYNDSTYIDLGSLYHAFSYKDEIINFLATHVERLTSDEYTIRQADKALFHDLNTGLYLYLAYCRNTFSNVIVTKLSPQMRLIGLGPYNDGLHVDAKRASDLVVTSTRKILESAERDREDIKQDTADITEFQALLCSAIRDYVEAIGNQAVASEFERQLRPGTMMTFAELARICRRLDIKLINLAQSL